MILSPVIQWSIFRCDKLDYITGWCSGSPIIAGPVLSVTNSVAETHSKNYLIHSDSQGLNFEALFIFNCWIATCSFKEVVDVSKDFVIDYY